MKRCHYLIAFFVLVSATPAWSQTPIGTLHCNDANGVAQGIGNTVTVRGIVTGNQPTGGLSRFYIQDATGGINVFGTPQFCGNLGDDVEVTGTIAQFNGLTEVADPSVLTVHSTGNPQPIPLVLGGPAAVNATYHPGDCEPWESLLVRISNVYIRTSTGAMPAGNFTANTNYRLITESDSVNFCVMRIVQSTNNCSITNSIVGTPISVKCVSVTGIIVQFDSSAPHTSGYQLTPRVAEDIVVGDCEPTPSRPTTWGRLKTIYR